MKHKVKKYAGKDSSLVEIEERSTKSPSVIAEELARGPMDYATMGKRAGATPARSTMSGPVEYITDSSKEDTEKSSKGTFSGSAAADDSDTYAPKTRTFSRTGPEKKKSTPKSRYSDGVSSKDLGSQDFSSKAKPASSTGNSGVSKAAIAAGLGLAGAAGAGLLAGRRGMKSGTRGERAEPTMGGTTRSPVRSMTAEEASFENEGGRYFKKGGATKKMASGGKVSSASSRGDGIAQRGKTKGRMC
jgi:hypothetical protein